MPRSGYLSGHCPAWLHSFWAKPCVEASRFVSRRTRFNIGVSSEKSWRWSFGGTHKVRTGRAECCHQVIWSYWNDRRAAARALTSNIRTRRGLTERRDVKDAGRREMQGCCSLLRPPLYCREKPGSRPPEQPRGRYHAQPRTCSHRFGGANSLPTFTNFHNSRIRTTLIEQLFYLFRHH